MPDSSFSASYDCTTKILSAGVCVFLAFIAWIVHIIFIVPLFAGTLTDFTGTLRLWGSGGFFGCYGLFTTSKLGKCYWYATTGTVPQL